MKLETLKWLRIIAPGIIILACWWILGAITGLWTFEIPTKWDEISKCALPILLGGIYYVSPFRSISNEIYAKAVTENIRIRLISISQLPDSPLYNWHTLRGIFYSIIDSDESLTKKASLAYFNGFFWTTVADVRAISIGYAVASAALMMSKTSGALTAVISFSTAALISIPISNEVTLRHKNISNEQIEIIEHNYLPTLQERMTAIERR